MFSLMVKIPIKPDGPMLVGAARSGRPPRILPHVATRWRMSALPCIELASTVRRMSLMGRVLTPAEIWARHNCVRFAASGPRDVAERGVGLILQSRCAFV